MSQAQKQLKIKSGSLKRNIKDLEAAQKEVAQETARLQKFTSEGADEAKLKQQRNCIDEAQAQIHDCKTRITKSCADLKEFLSSNTEELQASAAEELRTATELIASADTALANL
eukprot:RCo006143